MGYSGITAKDDCGSESEWSVVSPTSLALKGVNGTTRYVRVHSPILSHRYYKTVCLVALSIYFFMFFGIQYDRLYSQNPICPYPTPRASWTRDFNIITSGGMIYAVWLQINRITLSSFREENDIGTTSAYYASLSVNVMALMSHFFTVAWEWGGNCQDPFGIITPGALWPEWIVTVPLLLFIALTCDDRPHLSNADQKILLASIIAMCCGGLLQCTRTKFMAAVILGTGFMTISGCIIAWYQATQDKKDLLIQSKSKTSRRGAVERKLLLASRKATLTSCLAILTPLFPMIYISKVLGFIDNDILFAAFMFFGSATKVYFASLCMDAHLEVSHPVVALIDAENMSNTSRRAFLRYVFHEIRVPLNTISLGLHVLTSGESLNRNELETVSMIKDAVGFMGDTLNDVMALQKIEEGSLALNYKAFTVKEVLHSVEDTFVDHCIKANVRLEVSIDNNVPRKLIGDKLRIRHVLANLASNAIKFSFPKSTVHLNVHCEKILPSKDTDPSSQLRRQLETGTTAMIQFKVIDHGKGITEEDQNADIFQPYQHLKSGELTTGRGAGLGLAICRELVHLHGGLIKYTSKWGEGTTFVVSLPLEVPFESIHEAENFAKSSLIETHVVLNEASIESAGSPSDRVVSSKGEIRQRINNANNSSSIPRVTRSMAAAVSDTEGWHTARPAPSDLSESESDIRSSKRHISSAKKKLSTRSPRAAIVDEPDPSLIARVATPGGKFRRDLAKMENRDLKVLIVDGKLL